MNPNDKIINRIAELKQDASQAIQINEKEMDYAYFLQSIKHESIANKVFANIMGLLAGIVFFAYITMNSSFSHNHIGLLIMSIVYLIIAVLLNIKKERITFTSISIFLLFSSLVFFYVSLERLHVDKPIIYLFEIIMVLIGIVFIKSAFLRINLSIALQFLLFLILQTMLIGIYHQATAIYIQIAILSLLLVYLYKNEALFLTRSKLIRSLYSPIKIGWSISFILLLIWSNFHNDHLQYIYNNLALSCLFIVLSLILILEKVQNTSRKNKILFGTLVSIGLLCFSNSIAIGGCVLMLLLSFKVMHKTMLYITIGALLFFLGKYYYDLSLSLLYKSILMICSGLVFLSINILLTRKKKNS